MIDESLRIRLEALNRAPILAKCALTRTTGEAALVTVPTAERRQTLPFLRRTPTATKTTAGLLRSGDIVETPHGEHLCIRLALENLWPNGTHLIAVRQEF